MQYNEIGNYIRRKRELLSISLNDFAMDCDVDSSSLSCFERGKSDILFSNFVKIAKGFGMTPAQFLTEFENQ